MTIDTNQAPGSMRNEPHVHAHANGTGGGSSRRIYNPVQRDYATFLETSEETDGRRTLLEIEVAPGGGTTPHYHGLFSERFEVLEGELEVQLGKSIQRLTVGQSATAEPKILHRFTNTTQQPTRFLIELRPGHTGFEQGLQIVYGLASDGKTTAKGVPKNLYHLAVVLEFGDTHLPGLLRVLLPVLRLVMARARRKGIEQELVRRYCR